MEFLKKKNVQFKPNPELINIPPPIEGTFESTIQSLTQARTPHSILSQYELFKREVFSQNSFIQADLIQLLFPLFIHLAKILHSYEYNTELINFVEKYGKEQPETEQQIIQDLLNDPENFKPPTFDIQISTYSNNKLMRIISKPEMILSSYIISTTFHITVLPYHQHSKLFLSPNNPTIFNSTDPALLLPINTKLPKHAVKFTGDPKQPPSVIFADGTIPDPQSLYNSSENITSENLNSENLNSENINSENINSENINLEKGDSHVTINVMESKEIQYLTQAFPDVINYTVYNHYGCINTIHISPNLRLLSYGLSGRLMIKSLDPSIIFQTGKRIDRITSHTGGVLCSSFSPDGRLIASGGGDCELKISHLEAFVPLSHRIGHEKPILDVTFNSHSNLITTCSLDRNIMLWDINTPHPLRMFYGHSLASTKSLFSKDNEKVISSGSDGVIRLWDIGTGNCVAKFNCDGSIPATIALDNSERHIVAACDDGKIFIWDGFTGKLEKEIHGTPNISHCVFTSSDEFLLVSDLDGKLTGYQTNKNFEYGFRVHSDASTIDSITVSERNLVVVCGRSIRGNSKI